MEELWYYRFDEAGIQIVEDQNFAKDHFFASKIDDATRLTKIDGELITPEEAEKFNKSIPKAFGNSVIYVRTKQGISIYKDDPTEPKAVFDKVTYDLFGKLLIETTYASNGYPTMYRIFRTDTATRFRLSRRIIEFAFLKSEDPDHICDQLVLVCDKFDGEPGIKKIVYINPETLNILKTRRFLGDVEL